VLKCGNVVCTIIDRPAVFSNALPLDVVNNIDIKCVTLCISRINAPSTLHTIRYTGRLSDWMERRPRAGRHRSTKKAITTLQNHWMWRNIGLCHVDDLTLFQYRWHEACWWHTT